MRGGCRNACDLDAQKPKSIYLPPRRECEAVLVLPAAWRICEAALVLPAAWRICEAALVLPAALKTTGGRSRLTSRLAQDARRRSPYLSPYCLDAATDLPAASSRIRGACRLLAALL